MSFTYFLKRAAFAALALAALMTSAFFLVRLTGDPVNLYLPVDASDAAREAMRVRLGLDRSLPWQFLDWAG
ncbi:ABC transporter permease, partial [Rhizobium ruizarguesonis]